MKTERKVVLSILESRNGFNAKVEIKGNRVVYSCDNSSYLQATLAIIINLESVYLSSYNKEGETFTILSY